MKSQKTDLVEYTMPNWGHWCSAGYRSKGAMKYFTPEDREAAEFLEQKDVPFNLIDLSECSFTTRIQAKIRGINHTPTLILENSAKLKGIEQIREHFQGGTLCLK